MREFHDLILSDWDVNLLDIIQANPAPGTEWIFFLRFANWGDLTR